MPSSTTRVFLLRHAKAASARPGERDKQRELDPTGRQEAALIGEEMREAGWTPDVLVTSAATRCRQTSDIVSGKLGTSVAIDVADSLYDAGVETYLAVLATRSESSVMLVGHNPTIEELFERLAGSAEAQHHLASGYPTAGLAVLERVDAATDGAQWRVAAFLAP